MKFSLQRIARVYDAIANGVYDPTTGQYRALNGPGDPLLASVLGTPPEMGGGSDPDLDAALEKYGD